MSRNKKQEQKRRPLGIENLAHRIMLDGAGLVDPVFFGPSPYLSEADTPATFVPAANCPDCIYVVETLEDGSLDHGLTVSGDTEVIGPGFSTGIENLTDSVDGDDGVIDGTGQTADGGFSLFTFADEITVTLPGIMQSAGLVWTDGDPNLTDVVFEAFDQDGNSIGTINGGDIADDEFKGQTAEDRFFGVSYGDGVTTGITMMTITNIQGGVGIEIDHIQFANCSACCDIDLELTKTVDNETPEVGDTVTWTIEIENNQLNANADATGVQVGDLLPAGVTLSAVGVSNGSYDTSTGVWSLADPLAPGDTETITLTSIVNSGLTDGTMITNVAEVIAADQTDIDSTPNNDNGDQSEDDEDSAKITVQGLIDLEVTKSVDSSLVDGGDTVTWTIGVSNNPTTANATATGVTLADVLPAGVTLVSASATDGSFADGVWTLADSMAPGDAETLTLVTTVNGGLAGGTTITNTTQVATADQVDIDSTPNNDDGDQSEDDEANANIVVIDIIDLEVAKSVDDSLVAGGDTVTWTIDLTNNADNANTAATGVELTDVLPAGVRLVSATPSVGTFAGDTWTLVSPLDPGATETLTIVTTVDDGLTGGTMITNTAFVSAANENDIDSAPVDGNLAEDDADDAKITVGDVIDLEVTKTVDQTTVLSGDTVTWTINVTNNADNANTAATGVQLADVLPSGLTVTTNFITEGTFDPTSNVWTLVDSLAPGETETLTLTTTIDAGLAGGTMLENTVQVVAADQTDIDSIPNNDDGDQSEDDEANAKVTLGSVIDLELVKSVDSSLVQTGDTVTWTIDLSNNATTANADATDVVVLDILPAGVSFVSAATTGDSTFSNDQWVINEAISPGESLTLTLVTTVDAGFDGQTIMNTTQVVAADQTDVDSTPNNDDGDQSEDDESKAQITVQNPALLMLSGHSYVDTNNDGIFQSYELPLMGVEITLMGTDLNGNDVSATTFTNKDGFYKFNDLAAGDYMVTQSQPVQFVDGKDTVGNLGGTNPTNDKLNVELTDNGVQYNFGELGLRPEYVNKRLYLTSTPYTSWNYVDVRQTSIWYSFDAAHQSFLDINGQVPIGDAQYTVLDANMNIVAGGDVAGIMADPIALAAGEYYIEFTGDTVINTLSVELTTPDVTLDGDTVIAVATAGDDDVQLILGSDSHVLLINGLKYHYNAQVVNKIYLGGASGDDTVTVSGTYRDDTGRLIDAKGEFESTDYLVKTFAFETTVFNGGGGNDVAKLFGSLGDDVMQSLPNNTTLVTPDSTYQAVGFDRVDAFGRGGDDTGSLYGTHGDDLFISRDAFTVIKGEDHFVKTKGFERINAFGRGGNDTAKLYDSTSNDRFISTETYASMVTSDRMSVTKGFEQVDAIASEGGYDKAYLYHLQSVDSFHGANDLGALDRDDREDIAIGFDAMVVNANAGANPSGTVASIDYLLTGNVDWI